MNLKTKKILITGGAGFIGSHIADELVKRGCKIRVADNLSTGKKENIAKYVKTKDIELLIGDLRNCEFVKKTIKGIDLIIHLAASHGGRGFIDLHQTEPATNLFLDGLVFSESVKAGVEKIVFASSGCVYPNHLQQNPSQKVYLSESMVGPPYEADNMYGWAKLMGEKTLKFMTKERGIKTASCRYFTVYGPLETETHAIIALIAKAFVGQNPYEVWGNGKQIRNWTYIDDIVEGTLLAVEKIDDGTAVNLGTSERTSISQAVEMILNYVGFQPKIRFLPSMPVGPVNRVANNKLARNLLGWQTKIRFCDGVKKTIDWYFSSHSKEKVKQALRTKLLLGE